MPQCVYELYYEQMCSTNTTVAAGSKDGGQILEFAAPRVSLTFDDGMLAPVEAVWRKCAVPADAAAAAGGEEEGGGAAYMVFSDREGVGEDEEDGGYE